MAYTLGMNANTSNNSSLGVSGNRWLINGHYKEIIAFDITYFGTAAAGRTIDGVTRLYFGKNDSRFTDKHVLINEIYVPTVATYTLEEETATYVFSDIMWQTFNGWVEVYFNNENVHKFVVNGRNAYYYALPSVMLYFGIPIDNT